MRAVARRSRACAVAALAAAALLAVACGVNVANHVVTGSGHPETRVYDLAGFTSLDVSHAFHVEVTRDAAFAVSVTADDNLFDDIVVERSGAMLQIGMRSGLTVVAPTTLRATVTMPALDGVTASGASHVAVSGFSAIGTVALAASGASMVSGDLSAARLDVQLSGASGLELTGRADAATLRASGASHFALAGYTLRRSTIDLSGASSGDVTVTEALERVSVSGASRLTYGGGATLSNVSTSGVSSISER